MAAYHFHVATPQQLQSMVPLVTQYAPTVARVARIWMAARKKKGETPWDRSVYAGFSGENPREAVLFRFATDGEIVKFGYMHYNRALHWCEQHLRMVQH